MWLSRLLVAIGAIASQCRSPAPIGTAAAVDDDASCCCKTRRTQGDNLVDWGPQATCEARRGTCIPNRFCDGGGDGGE